MNAMNFSEVPGYEIVEGKIKEINKEINIYHIVHVPNRMVYVFQLKRGTRKCDVLFSREFLEDLNDYTGSKKSDYWKKMQIALTSTLLARIEKHGLIDFTKQKLKELIFEHVKKYLQTAQHINKFNLLGRPYQGGSLESFLGVRFTEEERAAAGAAFDELRSQGILISTYKDLINPEDWVKFGSIKASSAGEIKAPSAGKPIEPIAKREETFSIGDLKKVKEIPIKATFLSSTVENLRDCRAEVVNELETKEIKVIYSESPEFAGMPRNNVYDICLQNVLTSSHFIIILDRKYGELYQGTRYERFKGISITHAELKVALEDKDKPILFYVRDYVWHHYRTWKNNPDLRCDIEDGVFAIIKEFEETKQYITPFKTSVDLKLMILKRLGIT